MATKKPKATITEIVARQNRLIDDAVGELRSDLTAMIGRVLPDVQSWLAGRLMVGGQDAVPPGPKSAATLRLLMRQINTGMKRAKLDARLEAWSDTFARQMPLFDEVLGLMGLPAMKWRDADIKWLANSKLSAEDQVRGVIESAAREVQTRALMQVSGLKLSELYRVMNERMQMAPATAASVADTSATIFLRSVHERGYTAIERDGDPLRFRFVGPHDKLERPFCDAVAHTGKGIDRQQGKRRIFAPPAAADGSYTREEIARMDNGQIPNAMLSGGGYRCRHQWIPVAIAPGPAPKPDPKVDTRTGEQVREQLARKGAEVDRQIAELTRQIEAIYQRMPAYDDPAFAALDQQFQAAHAERAKLTNSRMDALREVLYAPAPGRAKIALSAAAPDELRRAVTSAEDFLARLFGRDLGQTKATFRAGARAHYKLGRNVMLLARNENAGVVVHEAGHWVEDHSSNIHQAVLDFLIRRTTGPDGKREALVSLRRLTGRAYKSDEVARPDKFGNPYVGKAYRNDRATEVLSMGLQQMYEDPTRFASSDADYFDAIWAIVRMKP